jgi:phytanoyl-CoA hydroxylase
MAKLAPSVQPGRFDAEGYFVARGMVDAERCGRLRAAALNALGALQGPAEFEADVGYPGAPKSRAAEGGETPRRLLHAYSRDTVFREWGIDPGIRERLTEITGASQIWMSQCHHNCVMTKHPGYSSRTDWHQDVRYWSFDRPELVSTWLALGSERRDNGALLVMPGSHTLELDRGRLDQHLFLRPELEVNRELIESAVTVELEPGDVLFFHCRLFHAAGMNRSDVVKLSVVHTYHCDDNRPIPGTRSAQYPSVLLERE